MTDQPNVRLDETAYSPDAPIPVFGESIGYRFEFQKKVSSRPSLWFRSALQSIDAAITLLALRQISQAYLLFFQAAEVSLKGLLDEIRQSGIAAWAAKNPQLFRNRASADLDFDSSSFHKILTEKAFYEAFGETSAFVDFSPRVRKGYRTINNTRRLIVHRGGEGDRVTHYVAELLTILIPMLDEFYCKSLDLNLSDFILHDVSRELLVAARFMRLYGNEPDAWSTAISTIPAAYFHRRQIQQGTPTYFDPYGLGWNDRDALNFEWEEHCVAKLGPNALRDEQTICHICGERCYLSTDGELYERDGTRYFAISRLICPYCHLDISDSRLARIHYGAIDRETLGEEAWIRILKDFGYEDEAKLEALE